MYSARFVSNRIESKSRWKFYEDGKIIISASMEDIWGEDLDASKIQYTQSAEYGIEIIRRLREGEFERTHWLLTGKNQEKEK